MPNTRSGGRFEDVVEAGLVSVGFKKLASSEEFEELVMHPKKCREPTYQRQFVMHDELKVSGKQMLDFALIIPLEKPLARYSVRQNRLCMGIECRNQNVAGTVDKKNVATLDDLCGWGKWLPHQRLVLGGAWWISHSGKRSIDELQQKCGLMTLRGSTLRAQTIQEFSKEMSLLTGKKWEVDDFELAVIGGRVDSRQKQFGF